MILTNVYPANLLIGLYYYNFYPAPSEGSIVYCISKQSYISRTVWPRIIKFYANLHIRRFYNRAGYDVTTYFRSEVNVGISHQG